MKKRTNVEKVIRQLREVEVLQAQGKSIAQACRKLGFTDQTYYRWRKEYGKLSLDQVKRLKALESENGRLKKLVADLPLDKALLNEISAENFGGYSAIRPHCGVH